MDRWEQRHLRRILREELTAVADEVLRPLMIDLLAEWLAGQRDTQGVCGTARKAPTVSLSGDTIETALDVSRVLDSAPLRAEVDVVPSPALGGAANAAPPKRRARVPKSAPTSGTDRAGGLGQDDAATAEPSSTGGAALGESGHDPASIVTAHPSPPPRIPIRPRPSPPVREVPLDPNRPIAGSREPCRRCEVRGDVGCVHQRPFGSVA